MIWIKGEILVSRKPSKKQKRNLSTMEKITRVVVWFMLLATLGVIVFQFAMTVMNYK